MRHAPAMDFGDESVLRGALAGIAGNERDSGNCRAAALALLAPRIQQVRASIAGALSRRSIAGVEAAHAFSGLQDGLLRLLFDFAARRARPAKSGSGARLPAIVATGGYGRGLLAPFSDLDLLFLGPSGEAARDAAIVETVLPMLWDLGFKVGHAAQTVEECLERVENDMTFRTALLESRLVCGPPHAFRTLRKRFRAAIAKGRGVDFVEAKLAEREARHRKQGESRYLVEPNLKEGKGGLRDLQSLYWIGNHLYGADHPKRLVEHGVFSREECETFCNAEAFLWDVRCQLHVLAGRAEERLSFDVQQALAERLDHRGGGPRAAVERFMRRYFLVAKDVGDLTRIFCAAMEEQNRKPKPATRLFAGLRKRRGREDALYQEDGRLHARDDAFERDPVRLVRIFHMADAGGADIHPQALRTIRRSLGLVNQTLRTDETANRLFLEILSSRHDPERSLRRMNEAGLLGSFVPPFAHAVGQMQFNMYHHYTVDEHLIRTVGVLAAIERGELSNDHPLASALIHRIDSRQALYAAVFLHDVAKGLAGNHSENGAAAARGLCRRWGFSESETDTTVWLVRNHLLMSDTAQRRDISDPATLRNFVAQVQSPERLRLLLVLTVADIRAVGPGVWNAWKGQLLRDLYFEADSLMSGAAVPGRAASAAEARQHLCLRLEDWSEDERKDATAHYTDSYWRAFGAAELERNARLRARAIGSPAGFALESAVDELRDVREIVVCARDRPGLFYSLSRAIAAGGGSIVDAKAFTGDDGYALDVFSTQDGEGRPFGDERRMARLRGAIERALDGAPTAAPAIVRRPDRRRVAAFAVRPQVRFDNEASATSTVIEVEGADRPGLLSGVAGALFELRLSISSAIVATYGERVVDVFYVRDAGGHKIVEASDRAAIEARFIEALARAT